MQVGIFLGRSSKGKGLVTVVGPETQAQGWRFGSGRSQACGPGWALTKVVSEPLAFLSGHDTLVLQVTLVPHEDDLSVVPGVGLDLRGPVEFEGLC